MAATLLLTGKTRRHNSNCIKLASKQFDKNEGVTLMNILILIKILYAWIAGETKIGIKSPLFSMICFQLLICHMLVDLDLLWVCDTIKEQQIPRFPL